MPLVQGKSKTAFGHNVSEMVRTGHPLKQSLAAAYAEKRKAERRRRLYMGGEIQPDEMSERDLDDDIDDADGKPEKFADGGNVLDANARKHIKASNFALPGRRYPIEDENHARNALARVSQYGSPAEKEKVRAAVHRKFPSIGKANGGRISFGRALRSRRMK